MKPAFLVWLFLLTGVVSHVSAQKEPPFLSLSSKEQKEAIHATRQAVRWWLRRNYSDLYSLYSRSTDAFNIQHEDERKRRFIKWCSAWRDRNPYNARLSEDEKIEEMRIAQVSMRVLTGFVMLHMSSYWDALRKGTWRQDNKMAFVEFRIRNKRYIQPLLREGGRWRILTIPLELDEQLLRRYETGAGDGTTQTGTGSK